MKKITLLLLLFVSITNLAQERLITTSGIINFEASIPFFEEVKSSKLTCVAIIKNFNFKRTLMQTHFNENYLESHKFPKAVFKGKIEKFDLKNIDSEGKDYTIKGKLEIHGVTKFIAVQAKIKKAAEGIELISEFALNTDDFKIEIPFIVRSKISKTVNTQIICVLQ